MSIFTLVVNEGKLYVPGDNQRCSNCGYNTRHGLFKTYAKHHCSRLGQAVVMNIWNMDAWPRQKSISRQSHFISLYFQINYLICLIVLYCYRRSLPPWYQVKFERHNLPFTIGNIGKGEWNWNMYEITPPCYVINICILYRLYLKQHGFLKEEHIGYTRANFHHAMTFSCRNIAFQIWWLPCEPRRSEWPKTNFGRCMNPCGVSFNGHLTRYAKLRVAHAPGMPGTFSPPPISKETTSQWSRHASRHVRQARAVMHVGIAN